MKAVILALVLAICGDAALNEHRVTSELLTHVGELVRGSADAFSGSFFAA